ncbi:MAG TPA: response regulator [Chryseolinea sp.]
MKHNIIPTILIADDDADDRMMIKEALEENNFSHDMRFVQDGEELLDYLHQRGKYLTEKVLRPNLIILDLNMPKVDGREALSQIKSNAKLKRIPVIVLTTSRAEEDIVRTYDLGVNSFICKPVHYNDLVIVAREIGNYWFSTVALPN